MLDIDINKLDQVWEIHKKFLKDGLVSGDIWDRETGLSLSGYKAIPEPSALFNQMTGDINETLTGSGFPKIGKYYMLNLQDDRISLVIRHGDDLLQGMYLNPQCFNYGILFKVVIPKAIEGVAAARN